MNAQEYILNIRPGVGYAPTVKISQYDIGRPLQFHLYDGTAPLAIATGTTIKIHATKPSGLGFEEACTWSGSSASIDTTESMTQEYGIFPAELELSVGGDIIGTANFMMHIERSPHPEGTTDGVAEDLQDIYEQLDDLKEDLNGWSDDTKTALLNCFAHVAWTDEHGQDYYDALYNALYPDVPPTPTPTLESISAEYTQSGTVYDTDTLDSLKPDLVVTAQYSDSTTEVVTTYTLSGTLVQGTSTITVTYEGETTTFSVTVSGQAISDETHWADGVDYTFTPVNNEYIDKNNGNFTSYSQWSRTPKLYCSGASSLSFTALENNSIGTQGNGIYNAFYKSDGTFIESFGVGALTVKDTVNTVNIPANAAYFACSHKNQIWGGGSVGPYAKVTPNA